jgi:hypothetical protein
MRDFARIGYMVGAICAVLLVFVLTIPKREDWHALGPANPGHETLACADCHTPAEGSLRQQLQANVRTLLGMRDESVTFGFEDVTNEDCQTCHVQPNDRHPVLSFNEDRFVDARAAIAPQFCESCHLEHQGQRVTIEATYCVNCHLDVTVFNDPVEVPHAELFANAEWETCLQCHDFHGNHIMDVPTTRADMFSLNAIEDYFGNGPSPYGDRRFYYPKESLNE